MLRTQSALSVESGRGRQYVENLAGAGRYHFGSNEANAALQVSSVATKVALNRLAKQSAMASPTRGLLCNYSARYRFARLPSHRSLSSRP